MKNERKIEALKAMKKKIRQGVRGLCSAYNIVCGEIPSEHQLKLLGLEKPKKTYDSDYWFKPFNTTSRIKLINKAIKKLQCK